MRRLSVQIRNEFAFEAFDHVLKHEFTLLQTPEHNVIDVWVVGKVSDYVVEIAMLHA